MKERIIIVAGGATGAAEAIRNVLTEKGMMNKKENDSLCIVK